MNRRKNRAAQFLLWLTAVSITFTACKFGADLKTIQAYIDADKNPSYTVTFNANGGSPAPKRQTVKKGNKAAAPQGVTLAGYTLEGWYTDNDTFADRWDFNANTVSGNITLYANWIDDGRPRYTVSFYSNGGSELEPRLVYEGERVARPPDPTRAGWAFSNWYADYELTVVYNFSTPVSGDLDLYASWVDTSKPRYIVTFHSNGGSTVEAQSVYEGERPSRPNDPARAGYALDDWYADTNFNVLFDFTAAVIGPTPVYARWTPATVTFDRNGGDSEASPQTVTLVPPATTVGSLPAPPARAGYAFSGWNTRADGTGTSFTAAATVYGNTTVYAQWTPVTVTFDRNGGGTEASPQSVTLVPPATTVDSLPMPPTRAGYAFTGWNMRADGSGTPFTATTIVSGNTTVYAQWIPATVTFDRNGGDTEASPQTVTLTPPAATVGSLPEPPARVNYNFIGWNTQANGTGVHFSAATTVTGNITVYAQWFSLEMVFVPGGSFEMGQNLGTGGGSNATPVHTVTLTTGFYMGKYEVTQAQYQAVMGTNPSNFKGSADSPNRPVETVSWYDAVVFCNKLSILEELTPAYRISNSTDPTAWGSVPTSSNSTWNAVTIESGSTGYRLPTEAQWEYAAKGGNTGETFTYAGSDTVGDVAWYSGNSSSRTHEVGTKAANGLGIYDMSGNVYEWCWDWYGSYSSNAQTDPTGASSGSLRV